MTLFVNILLILNCIVIAIEDLRSRKITVIALIALSILSIIRFTYFENTSFDLSLLASNFLFVSGNLLALSFYLKVIRQKKNPLSDFLGGGDIWLLAIACFYFPLHGLIPFLLISYSITFTYSLFTSVKTLPLAGIMCSCLSFHLITLYVFNTQVIHVIEQC